MRNLILTLLTLNLFMSYSQDVNENCSKITMKIDKFENDTTYWTPRTGVLGWVYFSKIDGSIFMGLQTGGATLNIGEKGVTVLLEGGEKIEKPYAVVDADVAGTSGYTYSSFFSLTDEEIEKLKQYPITDYRLYIYEGKPLKKNALKYMDFVKCLEEK
jgi:hypothetical protein